MNINSRCKGIIITSILPEKSSGEGMPYLFYTCFSKGPEIIYYVRHTYKKTHLNEDRRTGARNQKLKVKRRKRRRKVPVLESLG